MQSTSRRAVPLVAAAVLGLAAAAAQAAEFKVLVVMSYEENNPWVKEIREGVETVLGASSDITYFYMDTKQNRAGGAQKAEEAHAVFQMLQPNGVIAADDDAQAMFVVPYLKDRVATPVMFNGVNASAEKYGYPTANISGVLERAHVRESLAFIKQLIPSVASACFVTNNVPPGAALQAQVESEKASYPVKVASFNLVRSTAELESIGKSLRANCDTLFVDSLEGIVGADSNPLNSSDAFKQVGHVYTGPIIGGNRYQVEQGALAAVVKTGQEQGETAAEMLLKAMRGTPVDKLPIARNVKGQRVINASVVEARGIPLRPVVLRGSTLVRQQP